MIALASRPSSMAASVMASLVLTETCYILLTSLAVAYGLSQCFSWKMPL